VYVALWLRRRMPFTGEPAVPGRIRETPYQGGIVNCLDCAQEHLVERSAVGICTGCGAGVCSGHAKQRERWLMRAVAVNRQVPVDPPARVLRCGRCDAAHQALEGNK
jgi:hypothetical protein